MSLDHEDIQRIETIEEIIKKLLEEVNRLHNRICDMERGLQSLSKELIDHLATIEERLSTMDEIKKEKIKDIKDVHNMLDDTINLLPVGLRGKIKKLVKENTKEDKRESE